jgi:hypothetical protein
LVSVILGEGLIEVTVAAKGLSAIASLCSEKSLDKKKLSETKVCEGLLFHFNFHFIYSNFLFLSFFLSFFSFFHHSLLYFITKYLVAIVSALNKFGETNLEVAERGCASIRKLGIDPEFRSKFGELGACQGEHVISLC